MTRFSKFARVAAPLAFAALLGLAACSKDPTPDGANDFTQTEMSNETPPVEDIAPPAPEPRNEAPAVNIADAVPVDHTSEDQQMQEDAEASGLTSRLAPTNRAVAATDEEKPQ